MLAPDRLVLLGTSGSMWDFLVEHLAAEGQEEGLRLRLIDERDAYWMLKNLRNGLAHGNPSQIKHYRRVIADPKQLAKRLEGAMGRMLNATMRTEENP